MEIKQGAQGATKMSVVHSRTLKFILSLCILIISRILTFANPGSSDKGWTVKDPFGQKLFIENKGQFTLPGLAEKDEILYGARIDGLEYYFTKDNIWIRHLREVKLPEGKETNKKRRTILPENVQEEAADKEEEESAFTTREEFHQIKFPGAGKETWIVPEFPSEQAFTYGNSTGNSLRAKAYKRITYHNLFPGIDMEFSFPENKQGFKYTFLVHPGADPSAISMSYPLSENIQYTGEGSLLIQSLYGNFKDHAPMGNELETGKAIQCSFYVKKGIVHFNTDKYDSTKTLIIDPWTTTPVFTASTNAFDVDWDNGGNCYIYGGHFPFQVTKFNTAGIAQWTYTTTFSGTKKRYGDFAVDHRTGSVYIVEGYNSITGAAVIKLFTTGIPAANFPGNTSFTEMWRIAFSTCTNQLVIAGGGITSPSYTACYLDTSLTNLAPVNVLNSTTGYHDMWGLAVDNSGNCYMATAQSASSPGAYDNILFSLPLPSLTPANWQASSGYKFVETYGVSYTPGSISGYSNGYNGMSMGSSGLYMYDSHMLEKWNTGTGALSGSTTVNGPVIKNARRYGGITADNCDNVFLGYGNSIQQYNSLTYASSIPAADTVYDVNLGPNNILFACGKGFVSAIALNIAPCNGITVANHFQSCTTPARDSISVSGGTPPYTITWNTIPLQTGPVATNLLPGTYIATIKDQECTSNIRYDTVVIQPSAINIATLVQPVSCNGGSDGSVSLQLSGTVTPAPSYAWSNGATTSSISNISAGSYSVAVTINGCTQIVPVSVAEPTPIVYTVVQGTILCHGDTSSISVNITGGTPAYQVHWNSSPPQSGFSAHGLPAGNYIGLATDLHGCTKALSASLTEPTSLVVVVSTIDTGCGGNNGMASAVGSGGTGAFSYSWNPGGSTSTNLSHLSPGTYTVTLSDANHCIAASTGIIHSVPPFPLSFSGQDTTGCLPLCVQLTASLPPGSTCLWNFGDTQTSANQTVTHCYSTPGNYPVLLTASMGGCTKTVSHVNMVSVFPTPSAAFTVNPTLITDANTDACFHLTSGEDTLATLPLLWSFGDSLHSKSTKQNPCFRYALPGNYCITLKTKNRYGCTDSVEHCLDVLAQVDIFVPNSFTPNGDGLNDFFSPVGVGIDPSGYELLIFNRWGELIWKTNQSTAGWDGRPLNGREIVQEDVYVWKLECRDVLGGRHHLIGHVSVIK
jgi:gliding motility-associated-like protein